MKPVQATIAIFSLELQSYHFETHILNKNLGQAKIGIRFYELQYHPNTARLWWHMPFVLEIFGRSIFFQGSCKNLLAFPNILAL